MGRTVKPFCDSPRITAAKSARRRRQLVVRGDLRVPNQVFPWELDLLLPTVLRVVAELFPKRPKDGSR